MEGFIFCIRSPAKEGAGDKIHVRVFKVNLWIFVTQIKISGFIKKKSPYLKYNLVVEACAIILPPMGFFGSALNMAAPSTCATT